MRILSPLFFILILSGCEFGPQWNSFGLALKECRKYESTTYGMGLKKSVGGLIKGNVCLVSFLLHTPTYEKTLNCEFSEEQTKEISDFLIKYESKGKERTSKVDTNSMPWKFEFTVDGKYISNPIQSAIEVGACDQKL